MFSAFERFNATFKFKCGSLLFNFEIFPDNKASIPDPIILNLSIISSFFPVLTSAEICKLSLAYKVDSLLSAKIPKSFIFNSALICFCFLDSLTVFKSKLITPDIDFIASFERYFAYGEKSDKSKFFTYPFIDI